MHGMHTLVATFYLLWLEKNTCAFFYNNHTAEPELNRTEIFAAILELNRNRTEIKYNGNRFKTVQGDCEAWEFEKLHFNQMGHTVCSTLTLACGKRSYRHYVSECIGKY
uniref:Putative salivary lipocalin n=1 Tax=Ixodes ricinus TaxID=34613 RepID=A0A6B0UH69_IXORI